MPEDSDSAGFAIDNIDFGEPYAVRLTKMDDVEDCTSPQENIEYTICFENAYGQMVQDPFIIDWLPEDVEYPAGFQQIVLGDPNDPNAPLFTVIPPDPGYNEEDHSYVWFLDDIDPNASGCVQLEVVVKDTAPPGGYLHNVAELWGTVMVANDPNDPNTLTPEVRLLARDELDTPVCCYMGTVEVLYVDRSASNGADGLTWANAFLDLQDALDYARDSSCAQVHSIYVAQGTYSPGDNESDTFDLQELPGIALYGGFPSGGCDFSLRNPKRYQTILYGEIDQFRRNDTVVNVSDGCLIDGFTISDAGEYCVRGSGVNFSIVNSIIADSWQYGIRAIDGNVNLRWCTLRNNRDGVSHSGADVVLNIENCWLLRQSRFGVFCENSTPVLKNSIVTESDLSETGNAGIRMVTPPSQPVLQNCTISHNKSIGVSVAGTTMPSLINSIVYHNNSGGRQLSANLDPDVVAQYCCIADCNEVNYNINCDPEFAYFDPNNVRIKSDSPCRDSGITLPETYSQFDMDSRARVLGVKVDRGAYEIDCEDTFNTWDWNADGLVNYDELNTFSKAWMTHDPNDPAWIADPSIRDPNLSEGWYDRRFYQYNFNTSGDSQYCVDLADLMLLVDDAPWLWKACYVTEDYWAEMQAGDDEMMFRNADYMGFESLQTFSVAAPEPTVDQKIGSPRILMIRHHNGIGFFANCLRFRKR